MQYVHGFNYVERLKPQDNFGGGGGGVWNQLFCYLPQSVQALKSGWVSTC